MERTKRTNESELTSPVCGFRRDARVDRHHVVQRVRHRPSAVLRRGTGHELLVVFTAKHDIGDGVRNRREYVQGCDDFGQHCDLGSTLGLDGHRGVDDVFGVGSYLFASSASFLHLSGTGNLSLSSETSVSPD